MVAEDLVEGIAHVRELVVQVLMGIALLPVGVHQDAEKITLRGASPVVMELQDGILRLLAGHMHVDLVADARVVHRKIVGGRARGAYILMIRELEGEIVVIPLIRRRGGNGRLRLLFGLVIGFFFHAGGVDPTLLHSLLGQFLQPAHNLPQYLHRILFRQDRIVCIIRHDDIGVRYGFPGRTPLLAGEELA